MAKGMSQESGPILKQVHELLQSLATYVMNEVATRRGVEARFDLFEARFAEIDGKLDHKAGKEEVERISEDVQRILEVLDGMAGRLDTMQTEQAAFVSGLRRLEKRLQVVERRSGVVPEEGEEERCLAETREGRYKR